MDKRLEKRYDKLVRSHMNNNDKLASGIRTRLNNDVAFSQTQAAWRFFNNENTTLLDLAQPILKACHELCKEDIDAKYALIAHDWSHLSYGHHASKQDTYNTIKKSIGYELQTSLLLSSKHGGPLGVVAMSLKDKNKLLRSYTKETHRNVSHLDELAKQIEWIESQSFSKKLIHIIDREGDSVGFLRTLENRYWLVRARGKPKAHDGKTSRKIDEIAKDLTFDEERTVEFKGKKAIQQIGETEITILRPASLRTKRVDGSRIQPIKGIPVKCRLIVSKIMDNNQRVVAIWYLLSNVDEAISKSEIAIWYYWRWSIENYFKLMKSAGMQLESWQQTTSLALARRILVASMACIFVWRIAHAKGPEATEIRRVLIRLSGRQMKRGKEFTYPALLAGLWSLLTMDNMLNNYGIDKIKSLISKVFGDKIIV